MPYVYLIAGVTVFGAGLLLMPGWWKAVWVGAGVAVLLFLPVLLARVLDPLNAKRIRAFCESVGATDIEVEPYPNHYGVRFRKNGRVRRAKCTVAGGRITWKGRSPAEVE